MKHWSNQSNLDKWSLYVFDKRKYYLFAGGSVDLPQNAPGLLTLGVLVLMAGGQQVLSIVIGSRLLDAMKIHASRALVLHLARCHQLQKRTRKAQTDGEIQRRLLQHCKFPELLLAAGVRSHGLYCMASLVLVLMHFACQARQCLVTLLTTPHSECTSFQPGLHAWLAPADDLGRG